MPDYGNYGGGSPPYLTDGRAGSFQRGRDGRWHEYHGWGTLRPDGGINFNDNTPWGLHSHTTYRPDGSFEWGRPEGADLGGYGGGFGGYGGFGGFGGGEG